MVQRVKYSKAVLVSTRQYENQRVEFGLEDDVREGELLNEAYNRIKASVDRYVFNEVLKIKGAKQTVAEQQTELREKTKRNNIAKEFGFNEFMEE
jgi:hypothetical protein